MPRAGTLKTKKTHFDGCVTFPTDISVCNPQVCSRGEVIKVKVLGTLALIDEGETDWKVIVINTEDPEAASFNSMNQMQ